MLIFGKVQGMMRDGIAYEGETVEELTGVLRHHLCRQVLHMPYGIFREKG